MKKHLKIRIRHIFAVVLILIVSINFSGEADDDDDLDCSACDNSSDSNDSSDSCSSEATEDYDDDSSTFDCAACYSEPTATTGSSSSSSDNRSPIVTIPSPTINVAPGAPVSLLAIARDPDGDILKYKWMQISGLPKVVLTNKASTNATFLAPSIRTVLQIQFLADDGDEEDRGLIIVNVGP